MCRLYWTFRRRVARDTGFVVSLGGNLAILLQSSEAKNREVNSPTVNPFDAGLVDMSAWIYVEASWSLL